MNQCFWMNDLLNEWFNDSLKIYLIHYWMNQCFWMNESLERMIQWLTQDLLDSLLDESVFLNNLLNEWFNDSLKIYLIHYWMNQCFEWMNLLNEWFNDSLKIYLIHYWTNPCFWINLWTNDSKTHSRFIWFITGWISVFEWMNLLNEWFNDSLKILLDSLLDESVFLNESLEWMIKWLTQDLLVSLLDELVFLNESLEWMIKWLTQDLLVSLLDESVFLNESLEWMIQWNHPKFDLTIITQIWFLTERTNRKRLFQTWNLWIANYPKHACNSMGSAPWLINYH